MIHQLNVFRIRFRFRMDVQYILYSVIDIAEAVCEKNVLAMSRFNVESNLNLQYREKQVEHFIGKNSYAEKGKR
jgi:hypothetical protein